MPSSTAIIDVPRLAYKSASEVDAAVGKPHDVEKIDKAYADQIPGEFRTYWPAGAEQPNQVRFLQNKAVSFIVFTPGAKTDDEALALAGFPAPSKPDIAAPAAHRWTGIKANGSSFADVAVLISPDGTREEVAATVVGAFTGK